MDGAQPRAPGPSGNIHGRGGWVGAGAKGGWGLWCARVRRAPPARSPGQQVGVVVVVRELVEEGAGL